jgi:GTPase
VREAPFLDFAPVVAISARTGQRIGRVLELALEVAAQRRRRVPTGTLNALLREATFRQQPPMVRGRRPRFLYATQATIEPPTFVLFASDAAHVHFSYRRYLENRIREAFGYEGAPIRLVLRERQRDSFERPRRRGRPTRAKPRPGRGSRSAARR